MKRILIVDDDLGSRESLRMILAKNHELVLADHAEAALRALSGTPFDLILLDVIMPGKNGIELLRQIAREHPHLPVIMISASTDVRPVVAAIKLGALDFIAKPYDVEELRQLVARALRHAPLAPATSAPVAAPETRAAMIGHAPAFRQVLEQARRAALADATVLITGESGTGKEMLARQIHKWSKHREEPFVAVHCGSLPETLMESELFGHERGAFTHALTRKPGRLDLAGMGTLFLDEVGEMSLATQVKLLRVLQEREYMRVGGTQLLRFQARVLAATNTDLTAAMRNGRFREDLYYRLNVIPLRAPALRERPEDIPLLAEHFAREFCPSLPPATGVFTPEALARLACYAWPGNIRELRNLIERVIALHHGGPGQGPLHIHACHLGLADGLPDTDAPSPGLADVVDHYERQLVLQALRTAKGTQTHAAKLLGTTRRILKYKMDKWGIGQDEWRQASNDLGATPAASP